MQGILTQLIQLDRKAFAWLHITAQNNICDAILPFVRNQYFWAPLYIFLLLRAYQLKGKQGLLWALFLFFSFALADFFSASLLKPLFHRTRPCINPIWYGKIRHLVPISTGPSFPSTHASNHFAMSVFLIATICKGQKTQILLCLFWAALVAVAQVYVGVHYPADVIAGALLGSWIGYIVGQYFNLKTSTT